MDDITASIIVSCQTSGAAASIDKLGFSIGMLSKKVIQFGMEAVGEFQKTQDAAWKFGKTFPTVMGSAEKAVNEFMDTYNLSEQTARQMLTDTAQVLKGMGFAEKEALKVSESVSRWGVDLASFTGYAGGAKGAVEAITAAMLGENERLKGLGIVIREDTAEFKNLTKEIMQTKGASEQEARALAKLELITRKAADAKGDYMAEGENFTQTLNIINEGARQMKSNFGEAIYEIFGLNDALGSVGKWLGKVNKYWKESGAEWIFAIKEFYTDFKTVFELAYAATLKPFFGMLEVGFENIVTIGQWFYDNWSKIWQNAGDIGIAVFKDLWEYIQWLLGVNGPIIQFFATAGKAIWKAIKAGIKGDDIVKTFTDEFIKYADEVAAGYSKTGNNTAAVLNRAGVSDMPQLKSFSYDWTREMDNVLKSNEQEHQRNMERLQKSRLAPQDKKGSSGVAAAVASGGQFIGDLLKEFNQYRSTTQGAISANSVEGMRLQSRIFTNTSTDPAKQSADHLKKIEDQNKTIVNVVQNLSRQLTGISSNGLKLAGVATKKY